MKPIEIPPAVPGLPPRTFAIHIGWDAKGQHLGSIQADNVYQAATYASKQFFDGSGEIVRTTGWGGAAGSFLDTKPGRDPVIFWVGEPGAANPPPPLVTLGPTPIKPQPTAKPQPKRKRR